MDENNNNSAPLIENDNLRLPIGPDSPERAKLDELVSILNMLIKNASQGQERSVVDGLTDILTAFLSVPMGVRMRIQSHYRKVRKQPNFNLSDLVIEGDLLKELLELGAKLDTTGEHQVNMHRLVNYIRGFLGTRLQSETNLPNVRLKDDAEALVASSPFRNVGILEYFKKRWGSGLPQKLDYSEVREGFNAYMKEAEVIRAKQAKATIRMEAVTNNSATRNQAGSADLPKSASRKEGSQTLKSPVVVDPSFGGAEKLSMEPSRKKTFMDSEEGTIRGMALTEPSEEKTIVQKILFDLEYDKPLEGLNPPRLEIGDVIYCETASGSVFEFAVKAKDKNYVELEGVNGRFAGIQLFINDEPILSNGVIQFMRKGQIEINTLEVRKKTTLSKIARRSGIQTAVREKDESDRQDSKASVIGDSNGNFEAYQSNLKMFEVIDDNGHWKAGDRKVVILGDIVADRQTEGFQILENIRSLRGEAKEVGGDIVVVAGNHEDFMISFLLEKEVKGPPHEVEHDGEVVVSEGYDPVGLCLQGEGSKRGAQGAGLLELTQFTGDKKRVKNFVDLSGDNEDRLNGALSAMRKDPQGLRLLEELCQMKLCERIDATIFIHTDPTNEILEAILNAGAEEINKRFQKALRNSLFEGEPLDSNCVSLIDTFLYTENRTFNNIFTPKDKDGFRKRKNMQPNLKEGLVRQLKEKGIKQVIFGHSDLGRNPDPKRTNRTIWYEGVNFINVDQGAGKNMDEEISTASGAEIDTTGKEKPKTGTVVMKMSEIEKDKN